MVQDRGDRCAKPVHNYRGTLLGSRRNANVHLTHKLIIMLIGMHVVNMNQKINTFRSSPDHVSRMVARVIGRPGLVDWNLFRMGTMHGQWRETPDHIEILSLSNDSPGNGEFDQLMRYFEDKCIEVQKNLKILCIWNDRFYLHLIHRRGFEKQGKQNVVKSYTQMG